MVCICCQVRLQIQVQGTVTPCTRLRGEEPDHVPWLCWVQTSYCSHDGRSWDGNLGDCGRTGISGTAHAAKVTRQSSPSLQETSILPKLLKCLKPALALWQNTALAFHSANKHVKTELAFPILDLNVWFWKQFSYNTLKYILFLIQSNLE